MKQVYRNYYTHFSNISQLQPYFINNMWDWFNTRVLVKFRNIDCKVLSYDFNLFPDEEYLPFVIKLNTLNNSVSFMYCPDWVDSKEPLIVAYITYTYPEIDYTYHKGSGQIYHSKELFVSDTYKAFDIEEAKKRTVLWNNLIPLNDKCRIGYQQQWVQLCKQYGIDV